MGDGRPLRLASIALALAVAAGLSWVAADDLPRSSGVAPLVERNLEESGVSSPVTAVLLNFRAHDTLLEIAVLLAAAVAVFLLAPIDHPSPVATEPLTRGPPPTPMLRFFTPRLAPVAAVMAGYLWWAGSSLPGGAFQGGAVLAGAGVLLMLGGLRPPRGAYPGLRAAMAGGLLLFLLAAAAPLALGNAFLEYPEGWAKATIVGIEAARLGLVNRAVPETELERETRSLAETIAGKLGPAVAIGKRAFYDQAALPVEEAYALTGRIMAENMLRPDTEEGIAAFLDKRRPAWNQS